MTGGRAYMIKKRFIWCAIFPMLSINYIHYVFLDCKKNSSSYGLFILQLNSNEGLLYPVHKMRNLHYG